MFRGHVQAAAATMREYDVVVHTAELEPFGLVVAEALLHGVPVVCPRDGGPAEIVRDGIDGIHVDVEDPEALAQAILALVRDPALRERWAGRRGPRERALHRGADGARRMAARRRGRRRPGTIDVIDTHCHLLLGIDDGPRTREDSLALARVLHADGVSTVVCTPHWSRAFPTAWPDVLAATERARLDLAAAGVELELVPASELSPAVAVTAPLELVAERAIGGRYVVVEAVADTPAPFFASVLDRLRPVGLVPVFAHPERSRAVQRDPALLAASRRDGALVQTVAPSLVGRWGRDGPGPRGSSWTRPDGPGRFGCPRRPLPPLAPAGSGHGAGPARGPRACRGADGPRPGPAAGRSGLGGDERLRDAPDLPDESLLREPPARGAHGCRIEFLLRRMPHGRAHERRVRPSTSQPVTPSSTMSRAPPCRRATTGVPHAWASAMMIPKSSSAGNTSARADRYRRRGSSSSTSPRNATFGVARRRNSASRCPAPTTLTR